MISKKSKLGNIILWLTFSLFISLYCYTEGLKKGKNRVYLEIRGDISDRYFEVYGNPVDSLQQDKFQYIVYGEHYK